MIHEFDHYQDRTEETAIYPDDEAVSYLALGLNGEAGEVAEKVKKHKRGDDIDLTELEGELGDVLWYLTRLADELDIRLNEVADANLDKLFDRQKRDVLKGSGDER